jgi:hypothetical protein
MNIDIQIGAIPYKEAPDDYRVIRPAYILPGSVRTPQWSRYVLPADNQGDEPSCVGRAWAGWLEAMLRRHGGPDVVAKLRGVQIDASAIWRQGREMFHDDLSGGLHLHEGGEAAIKLGILPLGTEMVRVREDWHAAGEALCMTPLIQAHGLGAGWHYPSPLNGCIDHSKPTEPGRYGYHATLLLERFTDPTGKWIFFQNSWKVSWGFHGFGLLASDLWRNSLIPSGLWTASLPENWLEHRGWETYLVPA